MYLGGNEQSTHKYVSELLGKETIDLNTYGRSYGRNGSYSTNWQLSGRELMTPDEVRLLDNDYALLFIRGERPIMDKKFDIMQHPNIALTKDGGAPAYRHGTTERVQYSMRLVKRKLKDLPTFELPKGMETVELELLSEEEVYELTKDDEDE